MPILNWIGKDKIVNHDKELPFRVLKPNKKLSVGDSNNLLIQGDNLEALKALMPFYYNKVKCIYIDPPYNTGNDKWIYSDRVNSPQIKQWLNKTVGAEGEDLCRHDKWLCMMLPRLKLLHSLLRDDGVIFISIDDNEAKHLRLIMDEIFQAKNFIAQIVVQSNPRGRQAEKHFATVHEYLLVYAKNKDLTKLSGLSLTDEQDKEYKLTDDKGRRYRQLGLRQRGAESRREDRPNMYFPIFVNPTTKQVSVESKAGFTEKVLPRKSDGSDSRWMWSKEKVSKSTDLEAKLISRRNEWDIFVRDYLHTEDGEARTSKSKSIWAEKDLNYQNGKEELKAIFGSAVFDYPKPTALIKRIVELTNDKDGIYLDSFAGSGTTGHAILDLNKKDGGKRQFILVELENEIAKNVTAQRLKKVSDNLKGNSGFQYLDLNGELFNSDGFINQKAEYEDLGSYIYYTETKEYCELEKIKSPFIGKSRNKSYYLLFKHKGDNVLDQKIFESIKDTAGDKIIYADKTLVDEDILTSNHITFKQIPYELKSF